MTHAELVQAGCAVDADAHARLTAFVERLLAATARINLTAIRRPEEAWRRHVCDSLALLPLLDALNAARVVDVGTGGGAPGVPLACARPATRFALLDSTRKKIEAVRGICAAVGLGNVDFLPDRAETLAHLPEHRERYDAATARAVAKVVTLVEWLSGFVRVGGEVWIPKLAADAPGEIAEASRAAALCGLEFARELPYTLPGERGLRMVLVYRKCSPLPGDLPRPPGSAGRGPLA